MMVIVVCWSCCAVYGVGERQKRCLELVCMMFVVLQCWNPRPLFNSKLRCKYICDHWFNNYNCWNCLFFCMSQVRFVVAGIDQVFLVICECDDWQCVWSWRLVWCGVKEQSKNPSSWTNNTCRAATTFGQITSKLSLHSLYRPHSSLLVVISIRGTFN